MFKFSSIFIFAIYATLVYTQNSDSFNLQICDDDSDFLEIYGGKKFYLSKTKGSWVQANAGCHKSGLKFASLDTADEQTKFIDLVTKADPNLFGTEDEKNVWVGGFRKPKGTITDWTWSETGELIPYNLNWEEGKQDDGSDVACLALRRKDKNEATKWQFKNYKCADEGKLYYYFCQK